MGVCEFHAEETKLFNCKAFQLKTIRSVMGRRSEMEKETLMSEAWQGVKASVAKSVGKMNHCLVLLYYYVLLYFVVSSVSDVSGCFRRSLHLGKFESILGAAWG